MCERCGTTEEQCSTGSPRGVSLVVTRDGAEVAELRPWRRTTVTTPELIARRRNLPTIDLQQFRADIDEVVDPRL